MNIIIVGAGAAGLLAAYFAAEHADVLLLEKNEKAGKKIYITGKGRCNVCNACSNDEFLKHVVRNPRFLYPSLSDFCPQDLIDLFERLGCPIKVERGNRAYPVSEKASDITAALLRGLNQRHVNIQYGTHVSEVLVDNGKAIGVKCQNGETHFADKVIVATGGKSYPTTGSSGEGYGFFTPFGHTLVEPRPALVPLQSDEPWVRSLMGLSLKNVELTLKENKKVKFKNLGEMLFTHVGISGPLVLSASSFVDDITKATFSLNLKPALNPEKLEIRILREIAETPNKQMLSILCTLFPERLAEVMCKLCHIDPTQKANTFSKVQRQKLIENTLNFIIPISALRGFNEAVITRGGLSCKDFTPKTLESKFVQGLYAVGEMLDIDALTGGYNLFVAFATARRAALSASLDAELN